MSPLNWPDYWQGVATGALGVLILCAAFTVYLMSLGVEELHEAEEQDADA